MELASKDACTGCGNCRLVCKKKAVTFTRDALNNIYPVIDSGKCVGCGLCQKVCPAINQVEKIDQKRVIPVMLQTRQFGNLVLLVVLRKQFIDGV